MSSSESDYADADDHEELSEEEHQSDVDDDGSGVDHEDGDDNDESKANEGEETTFQQLVSFYLMCQPTSTKSLFLFYSIQGVSAVLCEAIEAMKWSKPTKIQIETIPVALEGITNFKDHFILI